MREILEGFLPVCMALVVVEVLGRLCAEDSMLKFVRSLAVTVLLATSVLSLFSIDWEFSLDGEESENSQLEEYLWGLYSSAAEESAVKSLNGLLETAGLQAEKILIDTDIQEDSGIVLKKVTAVFAYRSDAQRAQVLLREALGKEIQVEVQTDGD